MKLMTIAAATALTASPAFAQVSNPTDAVKNILAKGATYSIQGTDYALTYKDDGTYMNNGAPGGKYKAEGKKLCHTPTEVGQELCNDIPDTAKSGDVLTLTSEVLGEMKVTIK
jgi:hypothetical protein